MRSFNHSVFPLFLLIGFAFTGDGKAQALVPITTPDGKTVMVPAEKAAEIQAQMAKRGGPGGPPGGPPGAEAAKPDAEAAAKPKDAPPEVAKRGTEPPEKPDPEELKVRPDDDGKISFSFRNQPWPALIQWYAEIAERPLDWQELPGDFVNLASPGRYSLDETRDLFNRHLLARGYTMLDLDGGITVVKTEGINPAIVPRVSSSQLLDEKPYSFVRTSMECGWLLAPKLAEELKPMISVNGRLVALEQTNRIEAMDAAINLQQIAELLRDEQSLEARSDLAREFELRHVPAEEARNMLSKFLGIDEEEKEQPPMSPQMQRQQQMMQQQMMQQNGGQIPQASKKQEISIVINGRRNSLLVNAPPNRMAVAAQFIKQIDVPSSSLQSLADVESRIQVFRLTSLDPGKLAEIATDMNILEPSTKMRIDEKNNALILSGSAADRYIIKTLIERLDGSARQFEVLQLRRLDAQEVTESIMFLMGTEEKDDSNSNSRRFMYSYYGMGGGEDEKKDKDKFRVAANVRFRQVLLWANESEMSEVRNLLVKLGELPPDGGNTNRIRRIEASPTPETLEYLRQLQQRFNRLAPNTLELPPVEAFVDPLVEEDDSQVEEGSKRIIDAESDPQAAPPNEANPPAEGEWITRLDDSLEVYRLVRKQTPTQDPTQANQEIDSGEEFDRLFNSNPKTTQKTDRGNGAPIRIELDDEGNLVLISDDTKALDQLENLMLEVGPPRRPYTVFKVKHATAFWVASSLEDYFKDGEDDGASDDDGFMRMIYGMPPKDEKRGPDGLGKKRKLKFVSDTETGSIVVSGATTSQLKTIGELIELWDVPESVSRRQSRFTRLVTVRYSRAEEIASTIKDAYRDLLSGNDKAFAQAAQGGGEGGGGGGANRGGQRGRTEGGNDLVDTEGGKTSGATSFTFKGKLSLGIDNVGNTLLVSAEGDDLLDLVCEMIDKLDQAARPQGGMEIRSVPGTINVEALEQAMQFISPSDSADRRKRDANRRQTEPFVPAAPNAPRNTPAATTGNFKQ